MRLLLILFATIAPVFACTPGSKLSQREAEALLKPAGITASSSGQCTSRLNPRCTSYDGIRCETVNGLITLKKASRCTIVITGGTEIRDSNETYSHHDGYKVDIRKNTCIGTYVHKTFPKTHNSDAGFPCWQSKAGNIYCDERNHWDVTYFGNVP